MFGAAEPKGRALKVASRGSSAEAGYTARDIEVLEGLEPVRRRPGMISAPTSCIIWAAEVIERHDGALAEHAFMCELSADGF